MSYITPSSPHATYSSALNQTVVSTTTAYPIIFEAEDDQDGIYHKNATVTISIATPAVVSWTGHGLSIGAAVKFSTDGALPTGITAGTVYYIITAGFGVDSFQISTTLGGTAVNTSGSQSGNHTCTCVSRFYVPEAGVYLVQISALVDTITNANALMDIWFDVDGSNLANSNTQVAVDTVGTQAVVAVPIILHLSKSSYVRIFYRGSSTNIRLLAIGTQATPTRPACPSIILTVNKVSR